jgi:outer membrane protein TolC
MNKIFPMLVIVLCLGFTSFAQEAAQGTVLTMGDFVKLAAGHGTFKEILLQELVLKYNRILSTPQIQLLLDATAQYVLNLGGESGGYPSGGISLSGLFPASGTALSLEYDTAPAAATGTQTSSIGLKVEQSVLKNAFGASSRLQELMAGNEETLAGYQILEAYEDYLAQVIDIYIGWNTAYRNMLYAEKSLNASKTLLNLTKRKQQYGIALPLDVNKATLQVFNDQEQLNGARNDYETSHKQVALFIGLKEGEFQYIPGEFSPEVNDPQLERQRQTFVNESRTAKMLDLVLRIAKQKLDLALDDLLPTATVYAAYNLKGNDILPADSASSDLALGFSLSLPLFNTQAKAAAEIQKNALDKTALSGMNQKEQLGLQLDTLLQTIRFLKEQLDLADRKLKIARLIVDQEQVQYNQGRAGLDDLLDAYKTLDSINQARLQTISDLAKNYIEWLRFTDSLVDDNHRITNKELAPE